MKKKASRSASIPYHPPAYFLIFLTSNLLLSYFSFSIEIQLWFFLLGVLLPFVTALLNASPAPSVKNNIHREEILPSLPPWFWSLPVLAGLGLQWYQFTHLVWPIPDEGLMSYFSLELARRWSWDFFYSIAQHPPAFNWLLALYFKVLPPSLFSLWLFPALLTGITTVIAFTAVKKYFSNSFGLFYFFLFTASLWPLIMTRFCGVWSVAFLWEVIVLALFAHFLSASPSERPRLAGILGLAVGAGTFSTIPWIFLALPIGATLFSVRFRGLAQPRKPLALFGLGFAVFFIPFVYFSIRENNGNHMRLILAFTGGWQQQISDWLDYLYALLWGVPTGTIYRPIWGGMLNPVLGSLFFLGIIEAWRNRRSKLVQWVFIAFISCWFPALLSRVVEIFRVILIVPFLFFIVGMGARSLLGSFGPRSKTIALLLIMVSSFGLDFHHVQKYLDDRYVLSDGDCRDFFQTFRILKTVREKAGPGAYLGNVGPNMESQNLSIATYPFNAAYNPRIAFEDCRWIAVLVSDNYKPFLASRFPRASWFTLGKDHFWYDGNHALLLIPIENGNRAILEHWFEAERLLQPIAREVFNAREFADQKPFMDDFYRVYEKVKTDRFLASTLVERMLFYKKLDGTPPMPLDLVQMGIKDGYPLKDFYKVEAIFLDQQGKQAEAKKAYLKAAKP